MSSPDGFRRSRLFFFVPAALVAMALATPGPASAQPFTASDISIYVPLAESSLMAEKYYAVEKGMGFECAPQLENVGAQDGAVISKALFDRLALRVFGREESCPFRGLQVDPDRSRVFMDRNFHAAMESGIESAACTYENWRIVGFRYDRCSNFAEKFGDPTRDTETHPYTEEELTAAGCIPEARLVVQPFHFRESTGSWTVVDISLHLLYEVEDNRELVEGLKALQQLKEAAVEEGLSRTNSIWSEDLNPIEHRPHPGLRAEMGICEKDQSKPQFTSGFERFLAKFTPEEKLVGIAWMTADDGPFIWSFGIESIARDESGQITDENGVPVLAIDLGTGRRRSEARKKLESGSLPENLVSDFIRRQGDLTEDERSQIKAEMNADLKAGKINDLLDLLVENDVFKRREKVRGELESGVLPENLVLNLINRREDFTEDERARARVELEDLLEAGETGLLLDLLVGIDDETDTACVDSFDRRLLARGRFPLDIDLVEPKLLDPCRLVSFDHGGLHNAYFWDPSPEESGRLNQAAIRSLGESIREMGEEEALAEIEEFRQAFQGAVDSNQRIHDPFSVGQLGRKTTNCTSCHLVDQALKEGRSLFRNALRDPEGRRDHPNRRKYTSALFPRLPGQEVLAFSTWVGYRQVEQIRDDTNLRNFGYGPGFKFGVPRRTLFETEQTRQLLNQVYGDVQPDSDVLGLETQGEDQ